MDSKFEVCVEAAMNKFETALIEDLDLVVRAATEFKKEKPTWSSWHSSACFAYFFGRAMAEYENKNACEDSAPTGIGLTKVQHT